MSEWISVKDRLPADGRRYIVHLIEPHFGAKIIDTLRYDRGVWVYDGMPVPEPPKEG